MIAKTYIHKNIQELNTLYNKCSNQKKELYYSKLALLELCGWIEESMDTIVESMASRTLKQSSNRKLVKELIKKNYGFEYDAHFRKMLIHVIGLINVERLEVSIDQAKYFKLKAALGNLKTARNKEAHTHLKGVARSIDAPSVTKYHFFDVYDGLKNIEQQLKLMYP